MADRFPGQAEGDLTYFVDQKNGDRVIKQLSQNIVIFQCLAHHGILLNQAQ